MPRPPIVVHSRAWSWLRGIWVNAFRPERAPLVRHRRRMMCLVCGKTVAITSTGLWKHKCDRKPEAS
jgi:hypothetical protein